ncbi:MAG: glycosyltransferase [Rhodobacteraceae bacterium]|nr:glycosyltransferase [Paracoccaceae bacterium]
MTLYMEISPLQERQYTGVSVAAARIAEALLDRLGPRVRFFLRDLAVPVDIVREMIAENSGSHLRRLAASLPLDRAPERCDAFSYGLFPNQKTQWGAFSVEAQIVHDLSTILTPQFHRPETIQLHAPAYRREICSNDVTFCVSQATADDCAFYFQAEAHTELKVIVEGCVWREDFKALAAELFHEPQKPYVLVLATLEPRKNIDALLETLSQRPDLFDDYDFLFLGRAGWGEGLEDKLSRFELLDQIGQGLLFPGFVTEFAKYALLRDARLVVYPSIFEGFGLPVLEALSLGKHVLTSLSSSIPEVGGDVCVYFDPNFPEQFEQRLELALRAAAASPVNADGLWRAELFSWKAGAEIIAADYERRATAHV